MREWLVLLAVGLGTYLMRAAFMVADRARPPESVGRMLPHVGPAVLAAIVVPALVLPHGGLSLGDTGPAFAGAAVCCRAWWRTRSLPAALIEVCSSPGMPRRCSAPRPSGTFVSTGHLVVRWLSKIRRLPDGAEWGAAGTLQVCTSSRAPAALVPQ
jgi:branched-subunit amino acid transport protein